jgi:outer membrane immunogenic protein
MDMVQISRMVVGLAVFILLMGEMAHVHAADSKQPVDWSRPYIGGFLGYSWADLKYYEPAYPGFDRNPNINGVTGGLLLGYNLQFGSMLAGLEADAGLTDLSEGPDRSALNNYSAFDIDWNAHVRARLGLILKSTMLYVAGGLALARVEVDDTDPGWGKDDNLHVGWTIGSGIEHAIIKNLRVRVEYLYDDYGSKDYRIRGVFPYKANVDLTAHTIRIGLSYYF